MEEIYSAKKLNKLMTTYCVQEAQLSKQPIRGTRSKINSFRLGRFPYLPFPTVYHTCKPFWRHGNNCKMCKYA